MGFRLLTEYHSFLYGVTSAVNLVEAVKFPSPYGVSFILMCRYSRLYLWYIMLFPSPYGVSFILMWTIHTDYTSLASMVCFRLLTEYHSFLLVITKGGYIHRISNKVSVSLRSIIHSYYEQRSNI